MKVGEIFADDETKEATREFAMGCAINSKFFVDEERFNDIKDAFIAGVVWKQMKEKDV